MTFNPQAYARRSDQVAESHEAREQWRKENAHLALPFFVEGLRGHVPAIFPGEMAIIGAPSGDGKTKMMKTWHAQAQKALTESGRRAVTVFGSQEETTEALIDDDIQRHGKSAASSRPSVFIGVSFGMNAEDMDDLHMTNFINTIDYTSKSFAEPMPIATVFYDYIQATPHDPFRKEMTADGAYRHQLNDNTRRLFQATKRYKCPIVTASQTGIKKVVNPYHAMIPIPGRGDFSEASGIYQIPDFVYSFILMRNAAPVGRLIEADNWRFTVEKNLVFFWFLKARGHTPETAKGISRVFPLRIINDEYIYDPEYHVSMLVKEEK